MGGNILHSQVGTRAEREARVRAQVLAELGVTPSDDVIMEISNEIYHYDATHPWQITTMATTPNPDGTPVTTVTSGRLGVARHQGPLQMDHPLGTLGSSFVSFPDDVLPEAWETHDD